MKRRYTAFLVSLALLVFAAVPRAQGPAAAPNAEAKAKATFTHTFGPDIEGEPGFQVDFNPVGAQITSIRMLDHYTVVDHAKDPSHYRLSRHELADPNNENGTFYGWFALTELDRSLNEAFATTTPSLSLGTATWTYTYTHTTDRVTFSLDLGRGLTLDKSFSYEDGRRDLKVEFSLRAGAGEAHPRAGEAHRFTFFSTGVRSPKSEYVLGANPARAIGLSYSGELEEWVFLDPSEIEAVGEIDRPTLIATGQDGWQIEFAGSTSRFFGAFLYADDPESRTAWLSARVERAPRFAQDEMDRKAMPIVKNTIQLTVPAAGATSTLTYRLYLGPKSKRMFDEQADYARFEAVVNADLEPPCCPLPGAKYVARFLLWLLGTIQLGVGNWGVAIMILTLIVRGSLAPLNFRMQKTMRAYGAKMKVVKPKLDALQAKYKNDKKKLQMEMAKFQKEHKIFPPVGGCLPIFITMPIFIGLFTALRASYDLRHQPLFGWITDLSTPDQLFYMGLDLPLIGLDYFNILPLIMVFMWWWLQKGTPLPTDPQQAQMMKMMRWMPLMFGVMLYNYASGLMVYMITSSAWGIVEQKISRKLLGPIDPDAGGMGSMPMM